ncbi:hypothetical protein HYQ46_007615 [Verticillium longisporum]|nr:hypothetical protein HYQ44_007987 [Verticillium longisporum]KAG7142544.1 hypothetical protein HYQ46_007615 [Verticillium longisporum]
MCIPPLSFFRQSKIIGNRTLHIVQATHQVTTKLCLLGGPGCSQAPLLSLRSISATSASIPSSAPRFDSISMPDAGGPA